ncbi:hypothetical protein JCM11641_004375 [Rhodosporidiobolus odoratus]
MSANIHLAWQSARSSLSKPLTRLAESQKVLHAFLNPLDDTPLAVRKTPEVDEAFEVLQLEGMLDELLDDYLDTLRSKFHLIRSDVDEHLARYENATAEDDKFDVVVALLQRIGEWIQLWQAPVNAVWATNTALSLFRSTFLSLLHFHLPPSFAPALQFFLRRLLRLPSPSHLSVSHPHQPLALLTLLTLLDRFDPLLFGLIYEEIERRVELECKGIWEEKKLDSLLAWLNGTGGGGGKGKEKEGGVRGILGWVSGIYDVEPLAGTGDGKSKGKEKEKTDEAKKFLKPTFSRFEYHVHKMLGQLRTTELCDIILAYPASRPALEDLKTCLLKTDQRPLLLSRLSHALRSRLLHPGSDTREIITAYISLVRALRVVDPPGVLLSRATREVRAYLRSRKDTIHQIVLSLTTSGSALFEELRATTGPEALKNRVLLVSEGRDEAENYGDPKWVPEPVEAPADFRKSRGADIIQLLVSIYDTKDVFVKELQVLLAQRLLAIKDYGLEEEVNTISTLKLRFGDQALQGCDVMIKDLQDSHKLDQAVHAQLPDVPLHATIVSRLFWPSFQAAPLKLPGKIGRAQSSYDRTFAAVSGSKKLRWLPQLGSVNLTVELADGRSVTVDASPVQAAVLELFDKQDTWTSESLTTTLRLSDASTTRNALYFWSNVGVVRQLSVTEANREDLWRVIEHASEGNAEKDGDAPRQHVVEEEKQAVQSVEEARLAEMKVFWQFIQGMLTNLGALPLSRIHTTLNMLAPGYKGKTTDELTALLESVAAEGLVLKTAKGDWKIVK